ncbi:hypothetical protein [Burkholderia stabilis]|uniref:hypothetical protein n=1 Tax=Burkholderia stabilis TaxID=95485 RepID=UPI0013E924ED|nr:hypothetical protein [Burkholderia stabilis]
MTSSVTTIAGETLFLLPGPEIPETLSDIEREAPNLVPVSELGMPLRIDIPMWQNSTPTPTHPKTLTACWNHIWGLLGSCDAAVPPGDLVFFIPVNELAVAGTHDIGPNTTVIYPRKGLAAQWGDSDSVGACRAETPASGPAVAYPDNCLACKTISTLQVDIFHHRIFHLDTDLMQL